MRSRHRSPGVLVALVWLGTAHHAVADEIDPQAYSLMDQAISKCVSVLEQAEGKGFESDVTDDAKEYRSRRDRALQIQPSVKNQQYRRRTGADWIAQCDAHLMTAVATVTAQRHKATEAANDKQTADAAFQSTLEVCEARRLTLNDPHKLEDALARCRDQKVALAGRYGTPGHERILDRIETAEAELAKNVTTSRGFHLLETVMGAVRACDAVVGDKTMSPASVAKAIESYTALKQEALAALGDKASQPFTGHRAAGGTQAKFVPTARFAQCDKDLAKRQKTANAEAAEVAALAGDRRRIYDEHTGKLTHRGALRTAPQWTMRNDWQQGALGWVYCEHTYKFSGNKLIKETRRGAGCKYE